MPGAEGLTSRTTDSSEEVVEDAGDCDRRVCRRRASRVVRAMARCARSFRRLLCRMWTQTTVVITPRITNTAEKNDQPESC